MDHILAEISHMRKSKIGRGGRGKFRGHWNVNRALINYQCQGQANEN